MLIEEPEVQKKEIEHKQQGQKTPVEELEHNKDTKATHQKQS